MVDRGTAGEKHGGVILHTTQYLSEQQPTQRNKLINLQSRIVVDPTTGRRIRDGTFPCGSRRFVRGHGNHGIVFTTAHPSRQHSPHDLHTHEQSTDTQDGNQQTAAYFFLVFFRQVCYRRSAFCVFARRELIVVVV